MYTVIVYLIYFSILPLALIGIGKAKNTESGISKENSDYMRGVATCGVFLAHSHKFLEGSGHNYTLLTPFSFGGGLGVLLFLFIGGYGICKSTQNSIHAGKYWKRRFLNVYIPAVFIELLCVLGICFLNRNFDAAYILKTSFLGAWYVDLVMLEYLLFFIARMAAGKKEKILLLIMLIGNLAMFVIFTLTGMNERWRNGLFVYVFGVLIACYEEKIFAIIRKKYVLVLVSSFVLFCGSGAIFTYFKGNIVADFFKNIAGCCLAIVFICLFMKCRLGNPIINAIGKRSLFIYLIHLMGLEWLGILEDQRLIGKEQSILCLLCLTILLSELLYRLHTLFRKQQK